MDKFGQRIRLRVCGLCFKDNRILLINHKGLYSHDFWAPPGGGVEFGESATDALKREFREECKVGAEIGEFLFGCEYIKEPLHAVELFFEVRLMGVPALGADPEMSGNQIVSALEFADGSWVKAQPPAHLHGIFQYVENPLELLDLNGFFALT
jgi:8-oxo-dGTP diphosphatase